MLLLLETSTFAVAWEEKPKIGLTLFINFSIINYGIKSRAYLQ